MTKWNRLVRHLLHACFAGQGIIRILSCTLPTLVRVAVLDCCSHWQLKQRNKPAPCRKKPDVHKLGRPTVASGHAMRCVTCLGL